MRMQKRDFAARRGAHHQGAYRADRKARAAGAETQCAVIVDEEGGVNVSSKPAAAEVEIHGNFVDGREIEAGDGAMLDVRNPATGEVIAKIPNSTADDIDRAMKSARAAFEGKEWGGMDIRARARLVNRLADAFEANLEPLYWLETLNNGRPVNETRAQLSRLAGFLSLLRWAGVVAARRGDSGRRLLSQLHAAHADRHRRQLHAVQPSADDPVQIARRSAGERLRHRGQAVGIHPADHAEAGANLHRGGPAARRLQHRTRAFGHSAGKMLSEHGDINKLVLTGGTEAEPPG